MGIIKYLKNTFSNTIELDKNFPPYLVFPYKLKKGKVFLNKKAVVREDEKLIFAHKGKLLDVLPTGEHKLTAIILPKCAKRFRLSIPKKNNEPINDFVCNVYFVSLKTQKDFEFSTYKKLRYKNEKDGKFWVSLYFNVDFTVRNVESFMQNLFLEYSYLRNGEAEAIVEDWLSDYITEELAKNDYMISSFNQNKSEILEYVKMKLTKKFTQFGCEFVDVSFKNIVFSRNARKQIKKLEEQEALAELDAEATKLDKSEPEIVDKSHSTEKVADNLSSKEEVENVEKKNIVVDNVLNKDTLELESKSIDNKETNKTVTPNIEDRPIPTIESILEKKGYSVEKYLNEENEKVDDIKEIKPEEDNEDDFIINKHKKATWQGLETVKPIIESKKHSAKWSGLESNQNGKDFTELK